ncbi:MAG: thiopurine S-methyltransferase [Pseudomonadota bacterium]
MKPRFWLERWQKNQIGFHQAEHNKLLLEFWPRLGLGAADKVFVPLCGKSLDMRWLEHAGHDVVGVELAEIAVRTFFAEGNEQPEPHPVDRFMFYQGRQTGIYHGDFFDLTATLLEDVSALFDRGALVALPADMRFRYVDHLLRIIPDGTRMLLLTFEYDQSLVAGPPHSVFPEEIESLFSPRCDIELLESIVTSLLPPHFHSQGISQAVESVYLITKSE